MKFIIQILGALVFLLAVMPAHAHEHQPELEVELSVYDAYGVSAFDLIAQEAHGFIADDAHELLAQASPAQAAPAPNVQEAKGIRQYARARDQPPNQAEGNLLAYQDGDSGGSSTDAEDAQADLFAQDGSGTTGQPAEEEDTALQRLWAWLIENWVAAVLGFLMILEVIVNLTPTDRDNAWFRWLRDIIHGIIPNHRKGGGTHPDYPEPKA